MPATTAENRTDAETTAAVWKKAALHTEGTDADGEIVSCTAEGNTGDEENNTDGNAGGDNTGSGNTGEENTGDGNTGSGASGSDSGSNDPKDPEDPPGPAPSLPDVDPDGVKDTVDQIKDSLPKEIPPINSIEVDPGLGDNLKDMKDQISGINSSLKNIYYTYSGTEEAAGDSMDNIVNELQDSRSMAGDTLDEMADSVDSGVQTVTSRFRSMLELQKSMSDSIKSDMDILFGNEDGTVDISTSGVTLDTLGVISDCVNYGTVEADIDLGGIVGNMNLESDIDPEMDLDISVLTDVEIRSTVRDVVIHCKNYGKVKCKKNYCGGIVGSGALGLVYDCENYGSLSAESGSRVGGVAGQSQSSVQHSYAFCNISGTDYLGGICGDGYNLKENVAMCQIMSDDGEYIGSIAGHVDEEAEVSGNLFVSDEWSGIDNISYYGKADGCTYEELMEMGMPQGFSTVTVYFEKDGEEIGSLELPYGGCVEPEDVPLVEVEDGYLEWDREFPVQDVTENLVIEGEEIHWTTGLASAKKDERGKPWFLVEGEFNAQAGLILTEYEDAPGGAAYAYTWALSDVEEELKQEVYRGHFLIPEDAEEAQVWILSDGTWSRAEAREDGSYLTADIAEGEAFAVCPVEKDNTAAVLAVCAAGALILIVICIKIRKRRRTTGKRK